MLLQELLHQTMPRIKEIKQPSEYDLKIWEVWCPCCKRAIASGVSHHQGLQVRQDHHQQYGDLHGWWIQTIRKEAGK